MEFENDFSDFENVFSPLILTSLKLKSQVPVSLTTSPPNFKFFYSFDFNPVTAKESDSSFTDEISSKTNDPILK